LRGAFPRIPTGYRRQRVLVAYPVVQNQLAADAKIVLRVEAPVTVNLSQVTHCLRRARVSVTEKKRRKGTAAGGRRGARDGRLQKAEGRLPGDVLLAEAIGFLMVVSETELERVRPADVAEIVLERPSRLFRAVIRGAAPRGKLRERYIAQINVAIHRVEDAYLTLPVLADVDREGVFIKGIDAQREVIEHTRRYSPIVSYAV
jgi:hypothetical protein